jgi:hypothetical protein
MFQHCKIHIIAVNADRTLDLARCVQDAKIYCQLRMCPTFIRG